VVTLRNYGKSLNASGHPNPTATPFATAPSSSDVDASVAIATSTPPSKIPINLPPEHQLQLQANSNSIPLLPRASSLPNDKRARKRKQERPSSALENPQWHAEEPLAQPGAGTLQRLPSAAMPPLDLPRNNKILGRTGSGPAPLPLFQAAGQQEATSQQRVQQQSMNDPACNLGSLPRPPPLQLAPLRNERNQQGIELPAVAPRDTNQHYLRTPRKRENEA